MELSGLTVTRNLALTSPNMTGSDVATWQRILLVMQKKVTLDMNSSSLTVQGLILAANVVLKNSNRQTIYDLARDEFFDGVFGKYTSLATKDYQRSLGVPDDGVVGPLTAAKHNERLMAASDLNSAAKDALEFTVTGGDSALPGIGDIPGGKKTIGAGLILAIGAGILFFLKGKRGQPKGKRGRK